jgi:protein-L-isoaspartate O-methyltransferase
VAKKFGGYGYGNRHKPIYKSECPAGDPEKIFKEKLLELSDKVKIALDIGCADGKFTLSVAFYFKKVFGIDTSKVNLDIAIGNNGDERSKNVKYSLQDANKTLFKDESFDIVYSRRGPTPFSEFFRLLKLSGYFVGINIGEKDCQAIKEIFGRGQNYGEWNESRLEKDRLKLKDCGFKIIFAQDYLCDEYYATYEDLNLFLQGVPIFEDFDSEKDKKLLKEYVTKFKTEKGIRFPRHRVVIVAKKLI